MTYHWLQSDLLSPRHPEIYDQVCYWRFGHHQLLTNGRNIRAACNHFLQRPGKFLVAHYNRANQGLFADQQTHVINIEAALCHNRIGQVAPGFAVAARS